MDNEGFVTPMGRSRRLIISDGFKIAPDTIEDVIISLPYVKECIVVGVPDENLGTVPMAYIELEDNIKMNDVYQDIIEKCKKTLPTYEHPKYIEQIDKIPYTANG
jgi:acyl-CoA synthetase (AMP-forming)/AMP-acid ligase II